MRSSIPLSRGQVQSPFIQISPIDFYNLSSYEAGAMYLIEGKELGIYAVDSSNYIKAWGTNELFEPFSLTVNASDGTFTIPTNGTGYDYTVDWGDGVIETGIGDGDKSHTYASVGQYTIKIYGNFPTIFFNNTGDRLKVLSIESWGEIEWGSMSHSFFGCSNMIDNSIDIPHLVNVTNMNNTFNGASSFNGAINNWDVSNVGSMSGTFKNAVVFNQDIGGWDVSNVTTMSAMFEGASAFNHDLNNWDTGKVTLMYGMFRNASVFNGVLSSWNVSEVTDMTYMFSQSSFNQDVSNWDVSKVILFGRMFHACPFDGDLSLWNTSSATSMSNMFNSNTAITQIAFQNWDISKVTTMVGFAQGTTLINTANYTAALTYWATLQLKSNVTAHFGSMKYDSSAAANKSYLQINYSWSIVDGGPSGN